MNLILSGSAKQTLTYLDFLHEPSGEARAVPRTADAVRPSCRPLALNILVLPDLAVLLPFVLPVQQEDSQKGGISSHHPLRCQPHLDLRRIQNGARTNE
jgi:hypothetical protein